MASPKRRAKYSHLNFPKSIQQTQGCQYSVWAGGEQVPNKVMKSYDAHTQLSVERLSNSGVMKG
eukprot:4175354-Amphidinium_carterae.2